MGNLNEKVDETYNYQHSYNINDQIEISKKKSFKKKSIYTATVVEVEDDNKYIVVQYETGGKNGVSTRETIYSKNYHERIKTELYNTQMRPTSLGEWTTDDITDWLTTVELADPNNELQKLVENIKENGIEGKDLVGLTTVTDFEEQFDFIPSTLANYIYSKITDEDFVETTNDTQVEYKDNNNGRKDYFIGMVGLKNFHSDLNNICFANSVIQIIMQTPRLIEYLRKSEIDGNPTIVSKGWISSNKTVQSSMLNAFIELAKYSMEHNHFSSFAASSILHHLRLINGEPDPKFRKDAQCDALAALTKMLTLMDADIIKRAKQKNPKTYPKHTGHWSYNKRRELKEEEVTINQQLALFNPYESVIRDIMYFVERNIFTCMNCMKTQLYYEIKDKVLLPAM
eukprot:417603_1